MSILAKILGTGDVISKGMELIDSIHTSDEEEIAAKSKAKVDLLNAYSGFKVAQRYLALLFSVPYVCTFILVMVLTMMGVDTLAVKEVLKEFYIGETVMLIVAFYFTGGVVDSAKRKN